MSRSTTAKAGAAAAAPSFRTIDEATFVARFRPRRNHLNPHATFDVGDGGCLFETFGAELEFVRAQDRACIWTLLDGDGGLCLQSGYQLVNRIGYLVSSEPVEVGVTYTVTLD